MHDGLTLISYLGNYPEPAAGNRDILNFGLSAGLLLLLSIAIYLAAYRWRLSPEETRRYIDESVHEAKVEDAQLAD